MTQPATPDEQPAAPDPTTTDDQPPPSGRADERRDAIEDQDAEEPAATGTSDAGGTADASDPDPGAGAGAAGTGDAPGRAMLVERAAAMGVGPSPPPRRTGVFVDVEELRAHVGALLRSMLGGYEVDALGNFTFTAEGARIFTTVGPGSMGPLVGVFSILTVDQPLTPELSGFLLTTNHRMGFGSFSYDPEQRAVWLRHSLLGATLDGPELRAAVISIASTAGKVSTLLRERFGAGSFADASQERQAAVHPPEPEHDPDAPVNVTGYL